MTSRIYVGTRDEHRDAAGEKTRGRIVKDFGIGTVSSVRPVAVYALHGEFTSLELRELADGPLSDPVIQRYTINETFLSEFDWMIEVGFLPGVTDNIGRTAAEAVRIAVPDGANREFSVHTGTQYFLRGALSRKHAERIGRELLANDLINSVKVYSRDEWLDVHAREFAPPLVTDQDTGPLFREIRLDVPEEQLRKISAEMTLALSLEELWAIKAYYDQVDTGRIRREHNLPAVPTNVELEILAQTWSEHCKHKIFNARVSYREEGRDAQSISSLFKVYVQGATEKVREAKGEEDICLSVFRDNAGVIRFNNEWALVFKVETHNSPSALDPYGGALTGIVGVNRDPFGTGLGARLIANTDVFCFASPFHDKPLPPRILHPKRVFEGVREGVEHGGNKSGIPTVNGTVVFDERFLGKPLVYCGTLGIMPMRIGERVGYEKRARVGDRIVMVGGRIGKDGIHGATFSSEPLHEGSPATAVQIGDPITQKRMTDFLLRARDLELYNAITDNGAGGLSSSVGEMAADTNGASVDLRKAPLKYHGLEPWEIFLSEAQERMTVAVPPAHLARFMDLARTWQVEATDLGEFTDSGLLVVGYGETVVAALSMEFLHEGLPRMDLPAHWVPPERGERKPRQSDDLGADMLSLLGRLNICSKEYVVRQYDHEVQGGSVVKPLCGAQNDGPSDAAVIRPLLDSFEGVVVSNGIVPRYSDIDTYSMAACGVDEAVRNAVCVGADPDHMAALDNFCWSDPITSEKNPEGEFKMAQLVRANQALHDICLHYGVPLISGKDSMKNDYHIGSTRISIPPTLLVSLVAKIDDVRGAVTMDFKHPGNLVYLVGRTYRELGASEYALMKGFYEDSVPAVHTPTVALAAYRGVHRAINRGLVKACHDLSDGGLGVALAEMCFSGELGVEVDLGAVVRKGCTTDAELLFSESQSRMLIEVAPGNAVEFESLLSEAVPVARIGTTVKGERLSVRGLDGEPALEISRIDARAAWKAPLKF